MAQALLEDNSIEAIWLRWRSGQGSYFDIARDKSMSDKKRDDRREGETDSYTQEMIKIILPPRWA
jgi:hypothetical protein